VRPRPRPSNADPTPTESPAFGLDYVACASAVTAAAPTHRGRLEPVAAETYSLRITVDAAFKEDLETLRALLAHKVPSGDLSAVVREAVRCAVEQYGKRRGAVAPRRKAAPAAAQRDSFPPQPPASGNPRYISAAVRREVWQRDGGRCAWVSADGRRCESRWQLELDHVMPVALGGTSVASNLWIACRIHNLLRAEQVFGRECMARFRRDGSAAPRSGEFTIAGDSEGGAGARRPNSSVGPVGSPP
jgi:5-methylcytosine-specific restriction endonuclease McrA